MEEEEFASNDEKVLRNDFDIMEKNIKKGCHDDIWRCTGHCQIHVSRSKFST